VLRAAVVAGILSGAPSTLHAVAAGRSPFDALRAAGTLAVGEDAPPDVRALAGLAVHGALSLGWAAVLAAALPRRRSTWWGALGGLGIAALDLGVVGRRSPAIAELPRAAQVADHVAFGAVVGFLFGRGQGRG